MNRLHKRFLRPEIMDDPALDAEIHHGALEGLHRINALSRISASIFQRLRSVVTDKRSSLRVLDIATGGGDIPIALAKKARQFNLPIEFAACDKSRTAIHYARSAAEKKNLKVDFFQLDIFSAEIPENYDVILCNLFLHHLPIVQTRAFLKKISKAARSAVLISDLERCRAGFILAACIPPLLRASRVVRQDGIQSVRAAYSLGEIKRISERAGLERAQIKRIWPFRYELFWRKHE